MTATEKQMAKAYNRLLNESPAMQSLTKSEEMDYQLSKSYGYGGLGDPYERWRQQIFDEVADVVAKAFETTRQEVWDAWIEWTHSSDEHYYYRQR